MANSIRVLALASRIMDRYDRNDDGVINLKGNDRAYNAGQMSEAVVANRTIDSNWQESGGKYRNLASTFSEERVDFSRFFRAADRNGDQVVEREEILAQIRLFDENGDDRISLDPHNHWSELRQMKRQFPEVWEAKTYRLQYGPHGYIDPRSHGVDIRSDLYDLPRSPHH